MELAFIIWAVGTLPSIALNMCFILFILIMTALFSVLYCTLEESNTDIIPEDRVLAGKFKRVSKWVLCFSIPLWFIFLLVPDKDTSYQMLAAYGVQTIVQNETTQELASDGVDVLKALMKKAKKELDVETSVEK